MPDEAKTDADVVAKSDSKTTAPDRIPLETDREWVTTQHKLNGFDYEATVGQMPLKSTKGEVDAGIFFTAYQRKGDHDPSTRPLMFTFNGGPGSASVWLHLGAVGPKRVVLQPDGGMPAPPYRLVDNPQSWLEFADLVFIDPVGTGYSRAATDELAKKNWGLEGDIASVAEFIRLYLGRTQRWSSPLYLAGESYGTTRAAGLSRYLVERGIAMSGLILVSSILNFQTARFMKGNDLPYILFLPTYAATAWYHKRLPGRRSLESVLKEAETFAAGEYTLALAQGDQLPRTDRARIIAKLTRLTGLSPAYLESTDLRIQIHRFCKELLRDQKRTVGRLDSRFKGIDANNAGEMMEHDPASTAILPPYTASLNDYLQRTLGWSTDLPYHVFNPGELWKNWTYGDAGQGYPDTSEALRAAMSRNPYMKIFVASGFYDLATPYYATRYTLSHLGLDPSLRNNITTRDYPAGHMMYIDEGCLDALATDVRAFVSGPGKATSGA